MSEISEETPSGGGQPPNPPEPFKLPDVEKISLGAPFQWLAGGWADFQRAPLPCLIYGIVLAAVSASYLLRATYRAADFGSMPCRAAFAYP